MNREQKRALGILISMTLAGVLAGAAVATKTFGVRWLSLLLVASVAAVACTGGVVFFRLRPDKSIVAFDERDQEIQKKANLTSFGIAYLFLIVACFTPTLVLGENASIPVASLPLLFVGTGLCHAYVFFISIFIQYGCRNREGTT